MKVFARLLPLCFVLSAADVSALHPQQDLSSEEGRIVQEIDARAEAAIALGWSTSTAAR
jgi:hypothetical protein